MTDDEREEPIDVMVRAGDLRAAAAAIREGRMSEDKIIAADYAILEERAKLLAELSDITKAADEVTRLRKENARLRGLLDEAFVNLIARVKAATQETGR